MRALFAILTFFCVFPALQAQNLSRGSYSLKVEELRSESALQLTLSDVAGRILYQVNRELAYDTPRPAVHLYADGSVLIVDSFAGVYEYYGTSGQMVRRVPFNEEIRANHERITFVSGNDSTAAVLTSEPGVSESRILVLDRAGTVRFDRPFEGTFASGLLLSPNGELIAGGTYRWIGASLAFNTEFLTIAGTSVTGLGHEFKGGSWSPDGTLFVVYGRERASLINVMKREIISTSLLGENRIVHDVFWDGSIPYVASSPVPKMRSGTWMYEGLVVLNLSDGRTAYQSAEVSFKSAKLESTVGGVSAKIDGQSIRIR